MIQIALKPCCCDCKNLCVEADRNEGLTLIFCVNELHCKTLEKLHEDMTPINLADVLKEENNG